MKIKSLFLAMTMLPILCSCGNSSSSKSGTKGIYINQSSYSTYLDMYVECTYEDNYMYITYGCTSKSDKYWFSSYEDWLYETSSIPMDIRISLYSNKNNRVYDQTHRLVIFNARPFKIEKTEKKSNSFDMSLDSWYVESFKAYVFVR